MSEELEYPGLLHRGSCGIGVRRVQEWLCLHGFGVAIDERFGPATQAALRRFQSSRRVTVTGTLTRASFATLVAPMQAALAPLRQPPKRLGTAVVRHARAHLKQHPREVGGRNRGPWVRLYMDGHEGEAWLWCAGFVGFVVAQACESIGCDMPFEKTYSCDMLARQGQASGRFVSEATARTDRSRLGPGTIFLSRRRRADWTHTGIVSRVESDEVFATIEGNTNDDGSREGYEVCARRRGFGRKDFVTLA